MITISSVAAGQQATMQVPLGQLVEGMECLKDPSQTYTLYLPSGYTTEKRWPALLIFDPAGRSVSAAKIFVDAAERWGWLILSSNDTRSDGPMEPNMKALNAMWPEVNLRYASDPKRLYAAGFSGGGHVAYLLGKQTGELAGIIATGSRLLADHLEGTDFAFFGAAGNRDFNHDQMRLVDELLAREGNPHRLEIFDGVHTWMPPELAGDAVAWMELVAMQRELRPVDEAAVTRLFARDIDGARSLELSGEVLAALQRYQVIVRTYKGLYDVTGPRLAAARLERSSAVKKARKEEADWLAYEKRNLRKFSAAYAHLREQLLAMSPAKLRAELDLPALHKAAEKDGIGGLTARRLLATLYTELSYYLTRDFMAERRWSHVVTVLTVATEINPAPPVAWYNLACAHAHSGDTDRAIRALQRAVDQGYGDANWIQSDPDLESLREDERFKALVAALSEASPRTSQVLPTWRAPLTSRVRRDAL
jgi:predicted esterase